MNKPLTSAVAGISQINFTGDVIPHSWYHTMTKKGRPYRLAMDILAHLVYWHRWVTQEDSTTGKIIYFRKFKGEKYQCQYAELMSRFGVSKDTIKRAVDWLDEQGIITRDIMDVHANGQVFPNRMYLTPIPEKVKSLTFPPADELFLFDEVESADCGEDGSKFTPTLPANLPPLSPQIKGEDGSKFTPCTEITTEISSETTTENSTEEEGGSDDPLPDSREAVRVKRSWKPDEQETIRDIISLMPKRLVWKKSDYWSTCEVFRKLLTGHPIPVFVDLCKQYQKITGLTFNSPWDYTGVLEAWNKSNYKSEQLLDVLRAVVGAKPDYYRTQRAPGTFARNYQNLTGLIVGVGRQDNQQIKESDIWQLH